MSKFYFNEQLGADFRMVLTGPAPPTGEATDYMYHNLSTMALSIEVGPDNGGFMVLDFIFDSAL
jgi:hypothetical protein